MRNMEETFLIKFDAQLSPSPRRPQKQDTKFTIVRAASFYTSFKFYSTLLNSRAVNWGKKELHTPLLPAMKWQWHYNTKLSLVSTQFILGNNAGLING